MAMFGDKFLPAGIKFNADDSRIASNVSQGKPESLKLWGPN